MILEIPDQEVFKMLGVLRTTPIYSLLGSEYENELIEDGVKLEKWLHYEKEHAIVAIECYRVLLNAATAANEKNKEAQSGTHERTESVATSRERS